MRLMRSHIALTVSLMTIGCGAPMPLSPRMSFFVTSTGLGDGGNLGGIAGADAHCQQLAASVGSARTWHAYLSTPGPPPVNARERIGAGPWFNAAGTQIAANVEQLHRDGHLLTRDTLLTEEGERVPSLTHDMLTGSTDNGYLVPSATCQAWASNGPGGARVGHADRRAGAEESWNSAHTTSGCSAKALHTALGAGLFYCFAID